MLLMTRLKGLIEDVDYYLNLYYFQGCKWDRTLELMSDNITKI